jgi:hypothetical protein
MKQTGAAPGPGRVRAGLGLAIAVAAFGIWLSGPAGCSLLLDANADPYKCKVDADCARYPNAVCDTSKKECVPRFPNVVTDSGAPETPVAACQLSFDNSRVKMDGPDGGLRPLPEGP